MERQRCLGAGLGFVGLLLPLHALAAPAGTAVLGCGQRCQEAVTVAVEQAARRFRRELAPTADHAAVAAALGRVRATRALSRSRQLFTRTDFQGCSALLAISERELAGALIDGAPDARRRTLELLARVNLWLGICRWGEGKMEVAADHFVRSGRLPGRPAPDPALLAPEIVRAHAEAAAAEGPELSCAVEPSLQRREVWIDGGAAVQGQASVALRAGTHYVSVSVPCEDRSPVSCRLPRIRSFAFRAEPERCRIYLPSSGSAGPLACIDHSEARDTGFVSELTAEVGSARALVISVEKEQVALRLFRAGERAFGQQVTTPITSKRGWRGALTHSLDLLYGTAPENGTGRSSRSVAWYRRWWVWTLVGAAVAGSVVAVVLATRPEHVTEYSVTVGR
jgi:hypothetical protein